MVGRTARTLGRDADHLGRPGLREFDGAKGKNIAGVVPGPQDRKRIVEPGSGDRYGFDERSNFASPSPVTDGKIAVFLYGNGNVAGFDFAGKKAWAHDLQKEYGQFAYQWTYGASPTIYQGRLYIQVLQRDEPVVPGAEGWTD